jgi:hypothetical protein
LFVFKLGTNTIETNVYTTVHCIYFLTPLLWLHTYTFILTIKDISPTELGEKIIRRRFRIQIQCNFYVQLPMFTKIIMLM